jgi:cytochrome oxidase Cu insertion factor (SCO1/SenC/PrrC family)
MEAGAGLHDTRRRERVGAAGFAAVLVGAVLVGIGVGAGSHFLFAKSSSSSTGIRPSAALHGEATWPAGSRAAPAISTLRDQSGNRFSLASLQGRTVAMEFFDSHCKQECPLAGRALAAAERSLPRAQRPVLVVVSVNPLDTPASTRAAVKAWGLAGVAPWHWLRGTHAQLARVWKAYHIFVQPERGDISHTEALYLIDRHGDERSGYLYPYVPGSVAHDMRTLASARASQAAGAVVH